MSWLQSINTRLNLNDLSPKVISDYTNVLTSTDFLNFLKERNIKYRITDKIPEMLNARSAGVTVILTNKKEIPAFIKKDFTHKQFTFADIPLNGEVSLLLKDKTDKEIVALLNYVYCYNQHVVITKNNLKQLCEESLLYSFQQELEGKLKDVRTRIVGEASTENILNLGKVWGRVIYLSSKTNSEEYLNLVNDVDNFSNTFFLSGKIESAFYASTPKNPRTVDRILSHIKKDNEEKIALLCFDCMGYAEWFLLQDYLEKTATGFSELPLFTLMPSVTKFARTAIFHGSKDVYSVASPGRSDEAKAFASFYSDKHTKYFTEVDEINSDTLIGYDFISILYSFFDDLSHSTQFPPKERSKALYFKAINAYLEKTTIAETLHHLQANNFAIYICSDHGSIVSCGNGQRLEKYLVDSFAKRAAIIPKASASLVASEKISVPFQDDILLALPEGRSMFANINQIEINHGGITLEEMVVPFIKVQR